MQMAGYGVCRMSEYGVCRMSGYVSSCPTLGLNDRIGIQLHQVCYLVFVKRARLVAENQKRPKIRQYLVNLDYCLIS